MEPLSFAFAVVGMFQTCMQGYTLISDAHRAPQTARAATGEVIIESAVLRGWGEHFQISQKGHSYGKLEAYLSTSQIRNGVFQTLEDISETFTNVRKMEKDYGIVFKYKGPGQERLDVPRDIQDLLRGRSRSPASTPGRGKDEKKAKLEQYQSKMSLLQKCRWSWSGQNRFSDLVKALRKHNDNLGRLCFWEALSQINRGIPTVAPHGLNDSTVLDFLATAAEDGAKDESSPFAEGRKRIVEMARFKARLKTSSRISTPLKSKQRFLNSADYEILRRRETAASWTLAINQKTGTLNFIEWRTYIDHRGKPNQLAEDQIHLVAEFLCTPDRPAEFRTLSCLGIFKDANNHRYAFVHQLPKQLGSARPGWPPESLRKRRPTSLTGMFGNISEALDLGIRFTLAKRLMYSVIVIHACGWLHKDLRSDNIIFFPFQPNKDNNAKKYIPINPYQKDLGRPYIMGYGLSRPDDVHDNADRGGGYSHREPLYPSAETYSRRRPDEDPNHPERPSSGVQSDEQHIDIYQHPTKHDDPSSRFRHSFDVYSLGIILLELGLWMSLKGLKLERPGADATAYRKYLLSRLVPDLKGQCGSIYEGVVRECLTLQCEDERMDQKSQRRLCWDVAERLGRSVA